MPLSSTHEKPESLFSLDFPRLRPDNAAKFPVIRRPLFWRIKMRRLALGLVVALCLHAAAASAQSAFGHVDTPRPGDTVFGVVAVSGWVLDINDVSSIDLYVDGVKVATADTNLPRPDVLNVFPTYANSPTAQPGFITSFYTEKGAPSFVYPSGAHTVSIKV